MDGKCATNTDCDLNIAFNANQEKYISVVFSHDNLGSLSYDFMIASQQNGLLGKSLSKHIYFSHFYAIKYNICVI